jgi:hypothetical protein
LVVRDTEVRVPHRVQNGVRRVLEKVYVLLWVDREVRH